MYVLKICQVSIFQAAPTPSCWMPSVDLEATQRSVDYA